MNTFGFLFIVLAPCSVVFNSQVHLSLFKCVKGASAYLFPSRERASIF